VRILLDEPVPSRRWIVRIGYLSSGQTTAVLRLGYGTRTFPVQSGLHQIFFVLEGGDVAVELTLQDPGVLLCTNDITVGEVVAWP
jgi:hypothetical protein